MINEFGMQYSPIINHRYADLFRPMSYNGKTLSQGERKKLIEELDSTIDDFSSGFPLMEELFDDKVKFPDEYNSIYKIIVSVMQFVIITLSDCLVLSKYFIQAERDYDKRVLRGKLAVIHNEGFKQLYGFEKSTEKKSEWSRLKPILHYFPEIIQSQFNELDSLLNKQAKSSDWWRNERNYETHIDAEKLYKSRQEEIIESKVMIDSLKLIDSLLAVNAFLGNLHSCMVNTIVHDKNGKRDLTQ